MSRICKSLFITAVAAALLVPAAASAESQKPRTKIRVHPSRHWHGYGFLPGYRPSLAESQGVPILGREPRRPEPRYLNLYNGQWAYGWGGPGFYRGRYNGGSFGPCWTYTPIGMMPTCGQ
jgi:hypothetical protein